MKIRELMIGDWVHLYVNNNGITDENVKVISMGEDWINIANQFNLSEEYVENDSVDGVSAITPIHLTEEILKVNGFVHKDTMEEWWHEEYDPTLGMLMSNFELTDEFYFGRAKITYVHQLQHAFRLCGLNELADNFKL